MNSEIGVIKDYSSAVPDWFKGEGDAQKRHWLATYNFCVGFGDLTYYAFKNDRVIHRRSYPTLDEPSG